MVEPKGKTKILAIVIFGGRDTNNVHCTPTNWVAQGVLDLNAYAFSRFENELTRFAIR
jgi:hypothetical protein